MTFSLQKIAQNITELEEIAEQIDFDDDEDLRIEIEQLKRLAKN